MAAGLIFGAEDEWAFAPVKDPKPPAVGNTVWAREALDHFILAGIEGGEIHPTKVAEKRTLVRRAYLDLHGLPPKTEQIAAFVQDDRDGAWELLIDQLLESPRYGERWGRHWLDVARYADTNGMDEDIAHPSAWRYRDYVISAFNEDKPFDRFIIEQLAGDLLPAKDLAEKRAQTVGLGFLSVGPKMLACDDPDKMRRDIVDEQMDTMGRAFLGMTIGCARCHDHKIDPISIKEYYGLAGIFMSTKTLTKYSVVAEFHEHDLTEENHRESWKEVRRLESVRKKKETPKEEKERLNQEIATLKKDLPAPFKVMGVTEYPTQDVKVHLRGDYLTLGEEVSRGVPVAWTGGKKIAMPEKESGRLELARWIASEDNPLTSRVIANRLWRWHFGRGIVPTPDNFGGLGEKPTHPELLNHLARKFVESGWSVKAMHRLMMNSATYRQSSRADKVLLENDPENKLFARWQRRRVEAEVIRDSILMKSKRLDETMGGSMLVAKPSKYVDRGHLKAHSLVPRRTVYLPVYRSTGYDGQKVFDAADPTVLDGNRRSSTVAGQALYLMNSELMHESSKALAETVVSVPADERALWLVEHILGREATEKEGLQSEGFVTSYADEKEAWAAFARVLFSSNEFLYLE
ncbi:DUF1549 and DUF1553 domain-containing protein [Akkermansiaceae bacterium]|nr:DUF1549 and DUF1553 domain-containing protein [Akkermansiaceae bacterium]MDB4312301.1 DUF1549 and DUF1553 domain-containing protein [bacterium]MDA7672690.1 DUF1549 and DUF1553 domain-containing protein [Akkermansiaceae bacterium]MDB0055975.1 DUF1549 and DUF1553 domain-containing protein [Akkermansiaceae bacterium]MDB4267898.1 DUF1549 and DUF1553 domain-containing protein [Akkermansiaceae bacterium]